MLTYDTPAYMFNVYKNQPSRQTGSRNLTGQKTLPTKWDTYMKLVTKYQISAINICWEKCDEKWAYMGPKNASHNMGIPIWSLWPNIRFLQSIFAEKNATKNEHICSTCIKINKVSKQEVGIWRVQKRYPQYGIPIWSLWPNIKFLPLIFPEKNMLDGRKDGQR